jgi:hypothetical protein|tara:strand:+ start:218 stop:352 length:135 start_codon:yes stop_codon:yes gene_type:complete
MFFVFCLCFAAEKKKKEQKRAERKNWFVPSKEKAKTYNKVDRSS